MLVPPRSLSTARVASASYLLFLLGRLGGFAVGCPRATHVALSFQFFSKTHRNVRETVLSGLRISPRRVTNVIEWPGSADQLDVFLLSPFGGAYLFGRASTMFIEPVAGPTLFEPPKRLRRRVDPIVIARLRKRFELMQIIGEPNGLFGHIETFLITAVCVACSCAFSRR